MDTLPYVVVPMKHTKQGTYYPTHLVLPIDFLKYDRRNWKWNVECDDAFDENANSLKKLLGLMSTYTIYDTKINVNNEMYYTIYFKH